MSWLVLLLATAAFAAPSPTFRRGSDDVLRKAGLVEGDMMLDRNAVVDPALLWPYGIVPYKIDPKIGCAENSYNCFTLLQGMKMYEQLTCIQFKEHTNENHFAMIEYNYENACWSNVGYQPEYKHTISLGDGCFWAGLIVHELGHTLGFYHEQNRPDRDDYIRVLWENIIPEYRSQFIKYGESSVNMLGEDFDYKSVMLYEEDAFTANGEPTIEVLQEGVVIGPVWERASMSLSDVRRVHKLYECGEEVPRKHTPSDEKCSFDSNKRCGFKGDNWSSKQDYLHTDNGGELMSITYLQSYGSPDGCIKFSYNLGKGAVLKVHTENEAQAKHEMWNSASTDQSGWQNVKLPVNTALPFKVYFDAEGSASMNNFELTYAAC